MKRLWVLVADKSRARIFRVNSHWEEITHLAHPESRLHDKGLAAEPGLPHEHEALKFAHEVAGFLAHQMEHFDCLYIAASPKLLGMLRGMLAPTVQAKIGGEISKDLVAMSTEEVKAAITPHLPMVEIIDPVKVAFGELRRA